MPKDDLVTLETKYLRIRAVAAICLVLVIVGGAVWTVVYVQPLADMELSADMVRAQIESWGFWGILAAIVLMILHSFIPFPAEILAMAIGMAYGPLWGTVITWTGAMLGAYAAFGLARLFGRPFVLAMVAERHRGRVDDWVARQGGSTLFFSRFIPVISFNLINYAAGLTAVSWWTFSWATGLGILPLTFLMVYMGHSMMADGSEVWIWLFVAGVVGWLAWHAMVKRRAKSDA